MDKIWNYIETRMDQFNIKKKLRLLYLCCVLLPLLVTDSIILMILVHKERVELRYEMENIASAVQFDLAYAIEEASSMTDKICINRDVNEFLNREYPSQLEYFTAYQSIIKGTFFEACFSSGSYNIYMYSDNNTIVNGGHFFRLSQVREEEWYQRLQQSEQDAVLCFYFAGDKNMSATPRRKISFIRKLNYFDRSGYEKIIKYDLDYNALTRRLTRMKYNMPVYVCAGDRILFSTQGHSNYTQDYEKFKQKEQAGYEKKLDIYGETLRIVVMEPQNTILSKIADETPLLLFMISVNVLLPWMLMNVINRSFTGRLKELSLAFDQVEADSLKEIDNVRGTDEIGSLMRNYNRMVERSRELIKTVYQDRLEKQEMDIARQKAELLALHSQINPHFIFNVLESIRMHSVLSGEKVTAGMIERLAVLERQNVDWTRDMVTVDEEVRFIGSYLELQKFRFGDRLRYEVSVEPDCRQYCIPKLTLVTFVENSCVHGVENKASASWIYARVYREDGWLCLEIEDTGNGMEEEQVAVLMEQIRECRIDTLKEHHNVGVMNACLRLKMMTGNQVRFELESEPGAGTFMTIRIPEEKLTIWREEEDASGNAGG